MIDGTGFGIGRSRSGWGGARSPLGPRWLPWILPRSSGFSRAMSPERGASGTPGARCLVVGAGGVEFWEAVPVPDAPEIDYWRPVDVEQPSSPILTLAGRIADHIQAWLRGHVALPGHAAPIRPGDIMILLPRRQPFGGEIIRQLKLRDIPVAGADRVTLIEQIAVMDLVALGRFVLQRDDDLNLAALLRSPV